MTVIIPQGKDCSPLDGAVDELKRIKDQVPKGSLVTLGTVVDPAIVLDPATVEAVLLHLQTSSIVHFACHGHQDLSNPLDSSLALDDDHLKVSRLIAQEMPNAQLVFLNACQTATGDESLPDEVIHLSATLLFAGFRGSVATMWSIADVDGPKIADTFYQHLFQNNSDNLSTRSSTAPKPPDSSYFNVTQAAQALHLAVAKLRQESVSFARWVPFVHFGL